MTFRRGNRHEVIIDGQTVWLDSMNEETALLRIINQYGFGGKWLRPKHGIKHAGEYYSPDFEVAVDDYGKTSRALVEVKESRKDLTPKTVKRMCAVAGHYSTKHMYLYVVKKDEWYRVRATGQVEHCSSPRPGTLDLPSLFMPKRYPVRNWHGRVYYQSFSDSAISVLKKSLLLSETKRRRTRR